MTLDRSTLEKILISCKGNSNKQFTLKSQLTSKQIHNAISSYAQKVSPNDVVAILDDTLFQSGKEGFLITCTNLCSSYFGGRSPVLANIVNVELEKGGHSIAISYTNLRTVSFPVKSHGQLICAVLKEIISLINPPKPVSQTKQPDPNYKYSIPGRPTTADEMYTKAAEFYDNNEFSKALYWFIEAGNHDHKEAKFFAGYMLDCGEGTQVDKENAIEWYTSAAEEGIVQAMLNLGSIYFRGDGVRRSLGSAFSWYTKAADTGNDIAQNMCGIIEYERASQAKATRSSRLYPSQREFESAYSWFTKAAKQGNAHAQYMCGVMHENGEGVSKSHEKAQEWYKKAAAQGHADAKKKLK